MQPSQDYKKQARTRPLCSGMYLLPSPIQAPLAGKSLEHNPLLRSWNFQPQ